MLPRGWIIVLGKKEKQKLSFSMQAIFCVPSSTMVKFSLLNLPPWPMPGPWGVSDGSRLGPRESKTGMRSPMMTLGRRDQIWMTLKAGTHRPNRWMSEAIHPSIHPSIIVRLSGAGLRGQLPEQGHPDFPLPGHLWNVWGYSDEVGNKSVLSEEIGFWPSEPLDSLIGCMPAVWQFWLAVCWRISAVCGRGGILCALCFPIYSVPSFSVFMFWSTGTRVAVIMSFQDKLICVCLVMPHCMFSMQLFLSEIVKFCFDRK